jgi:hypothetical protein
MRNLLPNLVIAFSMLCVLSFEGFSLPSGITGRTLKTGSVPGCAMVGCHKGAEDASVTIKAPSCVRVGETVRCTVLVSGTRTGIDISVSNGALAPISRLLAVNGELTHPSAGEGEYVFDYTAPDEPGTQTLYATGLSGGASGPWNFAANRFIYVDLPASARPAALPPGFSLGQNYPNPFNPSTRIRFSLAQRSQVTLTVYNLLGEMIAVLANGWMGPGEHAVTWNAGSLPSGVYLYRLESGGAVETKRLILLR